MLFSTSNGIESSTVIFLQQPQEPRQKNTVRGDMVQQSIRHLFTLVFHFLVKLQQFMQTSEEKFHILRNTEIRISTPLSSCCRYVFFRKIQRLQLVCSKELKTETQCKCTSSLYIIKQLRFDYRKISVSCFYVLSVH